MEYDSVFKKNEMMPFAAACLDLDIIALREVSQRKANIMWLYLYAESTKQYKLTYLQNKQTHKYKEQTCGYQRGRWGRDKLWVLD